MAAVQAVRNISVLSEQVKVSILLIAIHVLNVHLTIVIIQYSLLYHCSLTVHELFRLISDVSSHGRAYRTVPM